MTDLQLQETYGITQNEIELLRDYCDVDKLTDIDLIYIIANIKILQQRLISLDLPPTLEGCRRLVREKTSTSLVADALRNQ